jgi:hypothetical protein
VAQLVKYQKRFLIIGNKNAVTYKDIFPLVRDNKMWLGTTSMNKDLLFDVPPEVAHELEATKREGSKYKIVDGVVKARSQAVWFTNLTHKKQNERLDLFKKYWKRMSIKEGLQPDKLKYPTYDNYDAIEVAKTEDIPGDYGGVMGVPITFLDKYNPSQFEILGSNRGINQDPSGVYGRGSVLNGKETFKRIFVRNKHPEITKA